MKKIGICIIIIGISIIIFYYIYNIYKDNENNIKIEEYFEQNVNEVNSDEDNINIEPKDVTRESGNKDSNNYTAILEIPKIYLKRGVVNSTKNFQSIWYAISVDKNSVYPDKVGNFILYAHSGRGNIAFFKNLYKLNINDDVIVYYKGIKYSYKIIDKYDIKKSGKAKIKAGGEHKYITLITCNQARKGYQTIFIGKIAN